MQTINDSVVYQLTNVGACQQMSPPRTPKDVSTGINHQRTPSSLSKGRKWAEKIANFQKTSSKRQKYSVSPSDIPSLFELEHSVVTPPFNIESKNASKATSASKSILYTARTSSLPKSSSIWYQNIGSNFTPSSADHNEMTSQTSVSRSTSFDYLKESLPVKKSFLNEICTICDEPLSNRNRGEKIIELQCSHIFHQECLLLSIDSTSKLACGNLLDVFPPCNQCLKETGKANRSIPKDCDLRDKLISAFLLKNHTVRPHKFSSDSQDLEQVAAHGSKTVRLNPGRRSLRKIKRHLLIAPTPTDDNSFSNISLARAPGRRQYDDSKKQHSGANEKNSVRALVSYTNNNGIEESFSDVSSFVSSLVNFDSFLSNNISRTESIINVNTDVTSLTISRIFFTKILLRNSLGSISDWDIENSFGLLRCVDLLLVSNNNIDYAPCWCFLFASKLVISRLEQSHDTNNGLIIETKFESFQVYAPLHSRKVTTIESSVLKCTIQGCDSSQWYQLYMKECESNSSKIIQKWISGLLDLEMSFNESNFSSTLSVPHIIQSSIGSKEGTYRSLTGLISPTKAIEFSTFEQGSRSLTIKQGVSLTIESTMGKRTSSTFGSLRTTISGILSLKRGTPDDLVVVLQLDYERFKIDKAQRIIDNSLKALSMKFDLLKLCLVDPDGLVVLDALISSRFDGLMNVERNKTVRKFRPEWLKDKYYPTGIFKDVALTIVSDTNMEKNKSCLFQDYKSFTSEGKRMPNQLKVKVGYSNIDYSDKIDDLVELESWDHLLEALSYSFTLYYGDDDDGNITDIDSTTEEECISDTEESDVGDITTLSEVKPSTAALSLSNSISKDEINSHEESSIVSGVSYLITPQKLTPANSSGFTNIYMTKSNKMTVDDAWDPLLNDIEQAIKEIEEND